ncbi:MAG: NAD-dependent epimerase/dehydratase family protein [Infirmifilum sp.]
MNVILTGGAGFIGSHLAEKLVNRGYSVTIIDNFSSGKPENLASVHGKVRLIKGDLRFPESFQDAFKEEVDTVFHFAANPEVRIGDPREHFENNIQATYHLLETMRKKDVRDIVFASTSTVYGDASILPTPEDYSPMKPISLYGASKLACESLLSSYAYTYGFKAVALRYANVVGPRAKRGVVKDFVSKLIANPLELEILGDGTQRKSYVWIEDAVEGTLIAWEKTDRGFEAYNVGSEDSITVLEVADIVVRVLGLKGVTYRLTGGVDGGRGWVGDVKYMHLKIDKLRSLGWRPKFGSREAVKMAAEAFLGEVRPR